MQGRALIIKNGQAFNMLTVLKEVEKSGAYRQFLCECECGKIGTYKLIQLTTGQTKSCGCLRKKTFVERNTFHDKSRSKLYKVWTAIKQRCDNKNCNVYHRYGGRGITICKEWYDFNKFDKWANENGYMEGLTIDRADNDGNYTPENCRWVKMKVQCRNKTTNVFIEFNGENLCIQDWANKLDIKFCTMLKRIRNWDIEKAVTTPKSIKNDSSRIRVQ